MLIDFGNFPLKIKIFLDLPNCNSSCTEKITFDYIFKVGFGKKKFSILDKCTQIFFIIKFFLAKSYFCKLKEKVKTFVYNSHL